MPKAKELRRVVEPLITMGKDDSDANRRRAFAQLRDAEVVVKLFESLGPRFKTRPGGYTQILRMDPRPGDSAPMALMRLMDQPERRLPTAQAADAAGRDRDDLEEGCAEEDGGCQEGFAEEEGGGQVRGREGGEEGEGHEKKEAKAKKVEARAAACQEPQEGCAEEEVERGEEGVKQEVVFGLWVRLQPDSSREKGRALPGLLFYRARTAEPRRTQCKPIRGIRFSHSWRPLRCPA